MADSLDTLLRRGEDVIWRDPGGWLPVRWHFFLAVPGLIFGSQIAVRMANFDLAVLAKMALVLLLFVAVVAVLVGAFRFARRHSLGFRVTERRVLYRNKDMSPCEGHVVLTDIEAVAFVPSDAVAITTRDGRVVRVTGLHKPQKFAAAVAEAAALPRPALPGPLARMEDYAVTLGGTAGFLLAAVLLRDWVDAAHDLESLTRFAEGLARLFALMAVSTWAGAQAACALGLVALRHRTSAEQARIWLHWHSEDKRESCFQRWFLWRSPPYVWFVSLLWGEPMGDPKEGANAHG